MTLMAFQNTGPDEIEALENVLINLKAQRCSSSVDPMPHLVKVAQRLLSDMSSRAELFDPRGHLFGDPGWAILLYVFTAEYSSRPASVSDAANASCAPPTTGLRYITSLTNAGFLVRTPDWRDRRRCFLSLSEKGTELMRKYLTRSPWI